MSNKPTRQRVITTSMAIINSNGEYYVLLKVASTNANYYVRISKPEAYMLSRNEQVSIINTNKLPDGTIINP
jgi:hypothetical protein